MRRCGDDIASRTNVQRGTVRVARRRLASGRGGFTLIELVVVIGIMILLIAIAAPAVGPAMTSNYRMQAINALNSSLAMAQTYALSNTTDVAIRIERATKLNNYDRMIKPTPQTATYLDYQQIRFVLFKKSPDLSEPAFEYIKDSKITALPSSIWFAPTNFYTNDGIANDYGPYDLFRPGTGLFKLIDLKNNGVADYCPFDTFYIVFGPSGHLTTKTSPNPTYVDRTQQFETDPAPIFEHGQASAPGVLMYERKKLENAPKGLAALLSFLRTNGQALYINRFLGTAVESQ